MEIVLEYKDESKFIKDIEQLIDPDMWDQMIAPSINCDEMFLIITISCEREDISRISEIEIEFRNGNCLEFYNCITWEVKLDV